MSFAASLRPPMSLAAVALGEREQRKQRDQHAHAPHPGMAKAPAFWGQLRLKALGKAHWFSDGGTEQGFTACLWTRARHPIIEIRSPATMREACDKFWVLSGSE